MSGRRPAAARPHLRAFHPLSALDVQLGLAAVCGVVLLQQLGAPIPAWPVLMLLGPYAVADPRVGVAALAIATAASITGSLPWFWAGRRFGHRVLRLVCRVSLSPDACVHQSESLFERYGAAALLASKFVPGLSRVAPPIAGALGHGVARFTLYFGAGSALGAAVPLLLGAAFGTQVDPLVTWLGEMSGPALAAVVIVVCFYAGYRVSRAAARTEPTRHPESSARARRGSPPPAP